MSGNIDFSRHSRDPKFSPDKMHPVFTGKKPRTPPRPDKLASHPSLDKEPKESLGPEDFPPILCLEDLPPEERGSDLAELLCEMRLPQRVRITESFVVPGCSTAINEGDTFLLHFIYNNPTVHATTSKGKNLRLPIYAKQKYEMLPLDPRLDDMSYSGTKALMDADPLPAAVRVVEAHCSMRKDEDQEADEIIELHGFEQDPERGRLLIGMSGSSQIKYSTDLTTSRYTTMLSPDFHPMEELIEHKFPQRIRIPDETKKFSERNFKEEKVLNLKKYSDDKCVVATRAGDNRIYTIPVTAPIKLTHSPISMKDKQILEMLPALYPLVNTSWGLVDPTQEALKTSMEAIPQPIQQVVNAWFNSAKGKARACEVADKRVENLKEEITITLNDMRRMKGELDFFKNKSSALNILPDQPPPVRPPRTPPYKSPKLPDLPEEPQKGPPTLPPRPPGSRRSSDVSSTDELDLDDYQYVEEATSSFPKDTPSDVMNAVKDILAKKERELGDKTQQIRHWKKQYETLKKENETLKSGPPAIYEELPDFPTKKSVPGDEYYLQPNPPTFQLNTRNIKDYTVSQVEAFLRKHDMERYTNAFRQNGVDGRLLMAMDEEHLLELEMSRLHALKLKLEIEKLSLPPLPH